MKYLVEEKPSDFVIIVVVFVFKCIAAIVKAIIYSLISDGASCPKYPIFFGYVPVIPKKLVEC